MLTLISLVCGGFGLGFLYQALTEKMPFKALMVTLAVGIGLLAIAVAIIPIEHDNKPDVLDTYRK